MIYLDNHATTAVDPAVLEAMLPWFTEQPGNAASRSHRAGHDARKAVERARKQVAALVGASPKEVVFTSGATESNNLAILGVARAAGSGHVITVATEHKAVLDPCKQLEREGFDVTVLPVGPDGHLAPDAVAEALRDDTVLVSVMAANNEIGVLHPIASIAALCAERGVVFHTDAAQAAGKVPLDFDGIGLLSLSAHKLYGPKGIGALVVRRRPKIRMAPLFHGGGHERGLRSGTLPVPLIVGFGEACARCRPPESASLRDRLWDGLKDLEGVAVNGAEPKLPGNLNVSFEHVEAEALLLALDRAGIAVSSGSACTSATLEPSHVLRALGFGDERAHTSIRFGVGRFTTSEEIDEVVAVVRQKVAELRALNPLVQLEQGGVDLDSIEWG